MNLRKRLAAAPEEGFNLAGIDPAGSPGVGKKKAKKALAGSFGDELTELHTRLMAEEDRSVLLVLQGTDASGKSGTIKHVVGRLNPVGVRVAGFVEPTDEEQQHHFLWRIGQELPGPGKLGVFDRSHYEDILVPRVEGELSDTDLEARVADIVEFEEALASKGTVLVKCFLALSYDEQRSRFLRRLRRDDKRWKFNPSDVETRSSWDEFQAAYADAIIRTHTKGAPWYVVPVDHKWYRNWAIARLLVETLREMDPRHPGTDLDVEAWKRRLEAPA